MSRPLTRISWFVWIGLGIFALGTGPLFAIILAAKLGLTADPNPNPIGPGIVAGCTFFPGLVLILIGVGLTLARRSRSARNT